MRSATWIRNTRNSVRNEKYCGPMAISKSALRVFLSALSAMRQMVNANAPAISCGVFSRSLLNQWLLMRISGYSGSDETASHLTNPSKYAGQFIGYRSNVYFVGRAVPAGLLSSQKLKLQKIDVYMYE